MNAIELLEEQHRESLAMLETLGKSRPSATRQATLAKLHAALVAHMAIEEEIFYPALAQARRDGEAVAEGYEEHVIARVALRRCVDTVTEKDLFGVRVGVLKELIEHHVKEERTDLFPAAKNALGAERLVSLGAEMKARFDVAKKESPASTLDRAEKRRAKAALSV